MIKKKSKLSLHRRKRKAVIVSPFKRYEAELPTNGCSPFKSPQHKDRRITRIVRNRKDLSVFENKNVLSVDVPTRHKHFMNIKK